MHSPFSDRYTDPELDKIWNSHEWAFCCITLWDQQLLEHYELWQEETLPALDQAGIDALLDRAGQIEAVCHHEMVALLQAYIEILPPKAARLIHLGMTSSDVQDFTDLAMLKSSVLTTMHHAEDTITAMSALALTHAGTAIIGRTHLQTAEPTTFGLRLAVQLEQLVIAYANLVDCYHSFSERGVRGAVGTMANLRFAKDVFGYDYELKPGMIATGQTYPRQIELRIGYILSDIACTLHKLSLDMRLMSTEPYFVRKKTGVGSSAMPGKVNPIGWEKVTGISRLIPDMISSLWHVAGSSALERTLDDSSSRRILLPQMFYALSECLRTATKELEKVEIDERAAIDQVWQEWRAWVPSRLLTHRQLLDGEENRMQLHSQIERTFATFTREDAKILPHLFNAGSTKVFISKLLYLEEAKNMTIRVCNRAESVIKQA